MPKSSLWIKYSIRAPKTAGSRASSQRFIDLISIPTLSVSTLFWLRFPVSANCIPLICLHYLKQWPSIGTWQVSRVGTDKVPLIEVGFRILICIHVPRHRILHAFSVQEKHRIEGNQFWAILSITQESHWLRSILLYEKAEAVKTMRRDYLEVNSHMRKTGLLQNLAYVS